MLNNQQIQQIVSKLQLEKIIVIQSINLICIPTILDEDFHIKFNEVATQLKQISPRITLTLSADAEIDTIKELPSLEEDVKNN